MHADYWSTILPPSPFIGMTTTVHTGMQKCYNLRQSLMKSRQMCGKYRDCCVDNGLYSVANSKLYKKNGDYDDDDECEIDVTQPVSKRTLKRREKSMLKLALTHNAAVGVAQNFLNQFTSKLLKKNPSVKQHIQKQMTPIIVRDLNQQIKNHRFNEQRQMEEALILRNKHISTRKHLNSRKGVCMYEY